MSVYFPPRPPKKELGVRFASRSKINGPSPSSTAFRPRASARGAAPARAPGKSLAIKAARGGHQLPRRRNQ